MVKLRIEKFYKKKVPSHTIIKIFLQQEKDAINNIWQRFAINNFLELLTSS